MPFFDIPDEVRAAWPSGARDFDFLQGEWIIRHRRLRERLRGSNDWLEFETPFVMQAILGGLGNVDQCRISGGGSSRASRCVSSLLPTVCGASTGSTRRARGSFLRLWVHSTGRTACFAGRIATKAGRCLSGFTGTAATPAGRSGSRRFSADGGQSWETNWFMYFRRPDAT